MLGDQRDHNDCQRARSARDHPRPAADNRGNQTDHESSIQTHQGVDASDKGKRHRLRNQRQSHGEAGQNVIFKVFVIGTEIEHGLKTDTRYFQHKEPGAAIIQKSVRNIYICSGYAVAALMAGLNAWPAPPLTVC